MNYEKLYREAAKAVDELKERVRQLTDLLGHQRPGPTFVHLTRSEACVFGALMVAKFVTKEALLAALYSGRVGDEPEQKIVDVYMCKIRKKLAEHGITIETIWGRGYFLSEEMKERVRELDKAFQAAA